MSDIGSIAHRLIGVHHQTASLARPPDLGAIIAWGALLLIALVLFRAWRGGNDFTITVHGQTIRFQGSFPASKCADITRFLLKDVAAAGKFRIHGKWTAPRILRVSVAGPLNEGQRQQIRNYLKLALGG